MIYNEAEKIFNKYILSQWSDWKPNNAMTNTWLAVLQEFEESDVKTAVFDYLKTYTTFKQPQLNQMYKCLKKALAVRFQEVKPKDPTANMVWAYNMRCTQAGTGTPPRFASQNEAVGCTDKHIHAFLGDVIVVYEDKTKAVDRILIKNEAVDYRKYLERTRGGKWDIEIT